jgi:hypothetical protein
MSKLEYTHLDGGVPTDAESVVFGDATDKYGIKRVDNDDIVVSDGYVLVRVGVGQYEYEFEDPELDLTYDYSINVEYPASTFAYVTGQITSQELVDDGGSYVTVAEADAYFALRLFADPWDDAVELDKQKALAMSTKAIQALAIMDWDTLPQDIKDATCENAYALLDGVNPEMEFENLSMTQQAYANVRSTYNRNISMEHIEAGIVSIAAWRLIVPYLDVSKTIQISRV